MQQANTLPAAFVAILSHLFARVLTQTLTTVRAALRATVHHAAALLRNPALFMPRPVKCQPNADRVAPEKHDETADHSMYEMYRTPAVPPGK